MKRLSDKFDPIDVIAMMIIAGCIITMAIRGDTIFKEVLNTIVGFYFGRNTTKNNLPPPSNGKTLVIIFILLTLLI